MLATERFVSGVTVRSKRFSIGLSNNTIPNLKCSGHPRAGYSRITFVGSSMSILNAAASNTVFCACNARLVMRSIWSPSVASAEVFAPAVGNVAGFSLHASVAAKAKQRDKLERLCRYITRPAIAEKRLSQTK
jgi:hypothetical protein